MSKVLFFVSLRVSPVVPAYLLNLAAPLTPLPLLHFWLATMVGCAPHAVVTVTAGRLLLYCCLIALQCCVSGAALGALVHVSVFYAWPMQNTASSQMVDPPQLDGAWSMAGAALSRLQPGEDVLGNNMGLVLFLLALSIAVAAIPTIIKRCGSASMVAAQTGGP